MTDQYQTINPTNSLGLNTSVPLLTPAKYFDVTGGNDYVNLVEISADRSSMFDQIPRCGCLNQISLLSGDDYLTDQDSGSFIFGHQGNDTIFGNGGNDLLRGGADTDQLDGGENNDTIAGDRQNDILTGGSGNDVFVWGKIGDNHDTITDFTDGADRIRLKNNLTYDDLTLQQVASDVLIQTRSGNAVSDIFLTLQNVNVNIIDSSDFLTRVDSPIIHDSNTPLPFPGETDNSQKSVITRIVPNNPYWGMKYPEKPPVVETPETSTPGEDNSSGSTGDNTSNDSSDSSEGTDNTESKFAPYPDIDYSAFYSLGGGGGGGKRPTGGCDPAYPDFCIPPAPPDLDCADVRRLPGYEPNFRVRRADPHNLDSDGDGIGCN